MEITLDKDDWRLWLTLSISALLLIGFATYYDSILILLPAITPEQGLNSIGTVGKIVAPISGLATLYTFFSSSPTDEQYASILSQLEETPTTDELVDLLEEHGDGEDPLKSAEVLISFLFPAEILEELDAVYRQNIEQIMEVADQQRPTPMDNVQFHHPLPLAFEIGSLISVVLTEEIEEGVRGDVLGGTTQYLTSYFFGIRAMQDAGISVEISTPPQPRPQK
ncbi:hypothetical protein [Halorarum salinum]|uniref:Uncharacterized protein n=1 Tax=Halorarum salinum TaxID=2743089 RepID=A0A7D5LAA6_9EURY|nr:hypothetical protein [Halobaculum salinum]QLG62046.1 hypothetical protein HUG12_10035 [Halobaculum salinum]